MTLRIAMWSGPRNISTAMMRSFENRPDTVVVDEPFYACYLQQTGLEHPMREEVIASQSSVWREVVTDLCDKKCEADIFYQKHMTHHMLDDIQLDWTRDLKHCFLVRDPELVVNSYIKKMESVTAEDIGMQRQERLYSEISAISGQEIPVIDATRFLENPKAHLEILCAQLGIDFFNDMLQWPAGRRESDGVWASHWYQNVEKSTGFATVSSERVALNPEQMQVVEESRPYYRTLMERSIEV